MEEVILYVKTGKQSIPILGVPSAQRGLLLGRALIYIWA